MRTRYLVSSLTTLICLFLLAAGGGVVYAQTPEPPTGEEEALPYDEAEAYAIDQRLMCPVCPAETIDQAQVPLARQMRQTVRQMLAQGATRQEILDFFAERYGQDVLASPPKSGFNLVAWVFPPVGVVAALVAGLLALRSMSARKSQGSGITPQPSPTDAGDLEPYLEMVDRDLSLRESSSAGDGVSTSEFTTGDVTSRRGEDHNHG